MVQLKRFANGGGKLHVAVAVDETIRLAGYKYKLSSIVEHLGSTLSRGHYVAYTRRGDRGLWDRCDDGDVTQCLFAAVQQAQPYVAIYAKAEGPPSGCGVSVEPKDAARGEGVGEGGSGKLSVGSVSGTFGGEANPGKVANRGGLGSQSGSDGTAEPGYSDGTDSTSGASGMDEAEIGRTGPESACAARQHGGHNTP